MKVLFLCLLCSVPGLRPGVDQRNVDLLELNHYHDAKGVHVYDQVIFWERIPGNGKYRVQDWVLVEDQDYFNRRPRTRTPGVYEVIWHVNGKLLVITSPMLKESWTQVDPERRDQLKWPVINRNTIKPVVLPTDDDVSGAR